MTTHNGTPRGLRRESYGPWATALDTEPGAALSTFWKKRMAMLTALDKSSPSMSKPARAALTLCGIAVIALPLVYLSRAELANAGDPPKIEEPTEARPTLTSAPAVDAAPDQPTPATSPSTPTTPKSVPAKPTWFPTPTMRPSIGPADEPVSSVRRIPEPKVEFFPEPSEIEKQIASALTSRADLEFTETPLIDVIQWIEEKAGSDVEIQLDNRALDDAGIDGSVPVTRHMKSVPLRAGLQFILDDLDLAYLIQNEVLLITTIDKAETQLITRTYPVGDLLATVATTPNVGGGMGNRGPSGTPSERSSTTEPNKLVKDYDSLVECITTTILPQSWDEVGGPGSVVGMQVSDSIVVSQTAAAHDELLALLRALRAAKRESASNRSDN